MTNDPRYPGTAPNCSPTREQLRQLADMAERRRAELVRSDQEQASRALADEIETGAKMYEAVMRELLKDGLGWLAAYLLPPESEGTWEDVVILKSVKFQVPGWRRFGMFLGRWKSDKAGVVKSGEEFNPWKLAGGQTAEELPSYWADDGSHSGISCYCLAEAVERAQLRDGEQPDQVVREEQP